MIDDDDYDDDDDGDDDDDDDDNDDDDDDTNHTNQLRTSHAHSNKHNFKTMVNNKCDCKHECVKVRYLIYRCK